MDPQFQIRELFHLAFLRLLASRLNTRAYALKGGVCLRFFHRSQRLSEDMDFDVAGLPVKTLSNHVNTILSGRTLLSMLSGLDVYQIQFTSPKQTQTTQRWKIGLRLEQDALLHTRLEFSRRKVQISYTQGTPDSEPLRIHRMPPFIAQYYDKDAMIEQKLEALAAQRRQAVRDLFDLHHLLLVVAQAPEELFKRFSTPLLEQVHQKISSFRYDQFQAEVVPFLTEELSSYYQKEENFKHMRDQVLQLIQKK